MFNDDRTRLPADEPARGLLSAGERFGQYKVVRLLGRGGMGEVYEVEHTVLHKTYALKVIRPEVFSHPSAMKRFRREAQVMSHLEHPHIVPVDEFGETDGHTWLRMPLLGQHVDAEGNPLESLESRLRGREQLPEAEVRGYLEQILSALAYAHGKGAIHRDIKPSNLLFDAEGTLKIADFGLVHIAGEEWVQSQVQLTVARSMADPDATHLGDQASGGTGTSTQALLGTFEFMAPEQKEGREADERSDLYAVGLMAFHALTGQKALSLELPSELAPGLDAGWDAWAKRALSLNPERRFSSAEEMAQALPGSVEAERELDGAARPKKGRDWTMALGGEVDLKLKWIAPGSFQMGSPLSESGRDDDERQHLVTLSEGYWLGAYEVTQGQWQSVMGNNPSDFKGLRNPVERVSWENAMSFCKKLTERERVAGRLPVGWRYTLPTETQWEYACRAGTSTSFSFGDSDADLHRYGNYCDRSNTSGYSWQDKTHTDGHDKTAPVGSFQPNAWGLYDMHGNVCEWCSDWCGDYPSGSVVDPTGASSGSRRVLRGGGWNLNARGCRSAIRGGNTPGYRWNGLGFRLSLSSVPQAQALPGDVEVERERLRNEREQTAAEEEASRPQEGDDWTMALGGDVDLKLKWIVPGSFQMGSPSGESRRDDDEGPVHRVTLSEGYWLGQYEVTQAQWQSVMESNPSEFRDSQNPVECVSWEDAMSFCKKLTDRERAAGRLPAGWRYTLPTEAQWEYACRAGTTSRFSFGDSDTDLKRYANYCYTPEVAGTTPVGSYKPNAWGLYDMHGNVWEWCSDCYGEDYPSGSVVDPTGASSGSLQVFRGGSWSVNARFCRSALRRRCMPGFRRGHLGFRLALSSVPQAQALPGGVEVERERLRNDREQTAAEEAPRPQEGHDWTMALDGGDETLKLKWIASGSFQMGSPSSESGRFDGERQHNVTLSRGYWLGQYEVTQAQWQSLMENNPSTFKGSRKPVEEVSWEDAMSFCKKLTERERAAGRLPAGLRYTLPTEAQWEYACRAGTSTRFSFGDSDTDLEKYAHYMDRLTDENQQTAPVGSFQPNAWGLYDMHGNVWEWCSDWYGSYASGSVVDPTGARSGSYRVYRGGSWGCDARRCRSANRAGSAPGVRGDYLGFRLALSSVPQAQALPSRVEVEGELEAPPRPQEGRDWTVAMGGDVDLKLKWIAPGSFQMGSPSGESGRDDDEGPVHGVTLSRGYWLGQYEVTYSQWRELMGTDLRAQVRKALEDDTLYTLGGKKQTLRDYWSLAKDADPTRRVGPEGDDIPMHYVSWEDAMSFCKKLTERERAADRLPAGWRYTLPTEAQWEYACRAGTATATYAGPMEILGKHNAPILDKIAWYGGNSSEGYTGCGWDTDSWEEKQYPGGWAGPRVVGTKQPNGWGLYDMHGNVYEWCSDWYGAYPSGSVVDPTGASSGSYRVFRGGSWLDDARYCRSAYRNWDSPGYRGGGLGFRLALSSVH